MRYKIEFRDPRTAPGWIPMLYPAGATEAQVRGAIPHVLRTSDVARVLESSDGGRTWQVLSTWRKHIEVTHHTHH